MVTIHITEIYGSDSEGEVAISAEDTSPEIVAKLILLARAKLLAGLKKEEE